MSRSYLEMIQKSVSLEKITFEEIAHPYLYRVTKGEQSFIMYDVEIGLNNSSSSKLASSKSGTYDALKKEDLPAVEHIFLINNKSRFCRIDPVSLAKELFDKFEHNVVLKQDNGRQGQHVYRITSYTQLVEKLNLIFSQGANAAIGPYYESTLEYRIVTLCGVPRIYFAKARTTSWKHNLIGGATTVNIDQKILPKLTQLATAAAKALQLDFCSVDILETSTGFKILEINEQVMLDEYIKKDPDRAGYVSELYKDAILQRFKTIL